MYHHRFFLLKFRFNNHYHCLNKTFEFIITYEYRYSISWCLSSISKYILDIRKPLIFVIVVFSTTCQKITKLFCLMSKLAVLRVHTCILNHQIYDVSYMVIKSYCVYTWYVAKAFLKSHTCIPIFFNSSIMDEMKNQKTSVYVLRFWEYMNSNATS